MQLAEIATGFYTVVPQSYAAIFKPHELMQHLKGQEVCDSKFFFYIQLMFSNLMLDTCKDIQKPLLSSNGFGKFWKIIIKNN